jgi:hypothetical protein
MQVVLCSATASNNCSEVGYGALYTTRACRQNQQHLLNIFLRQLRQHQCHHLHRVAIIIIRVLPHARYGGTFARSPLPIPGAFSDDDAGTLLRNLGAWGTMGFFSSLCDNSNDVRPLLNLCHACISTVISDSCCSLHCERAIWLLCWATQTRKH